MTDALLPVQRLPDNTREERGGGLGWFACSDRDGREAQGEGIEEAATVEVVDQQFAHELVGPVDRRWRGCGRVRHNWRQRRSIHGLAGGVDDTNAGVGSRQGHQQRPRTVQVHGKAKAWVGLGAGRHDTVEDEDGGQRLAGRDEVAQRLWITEIGLYTDSAPLGFSVYWNWRCNYIAEDDSVLGRSIVQETGGELLADEACGSCDEDVLHILRRVSELLIIHDCLSTSDIQ